MEKITGKKLKNLLQINAQHALYREDGKWYHFLDSFPGVLFDSDGFLVITQEEYDDYFERRIFKGAVELSIPTGIKSLERYQAFTWEQRKLVSDTFDIESTIRVRREMEIILRKRCLVQTVKEIYRGICQICNVPLIVGNNRCYSEVHHIVPLGNPHNGQDNIGNMLCVCPNHHVLLDLVAIPIYLDQIEWNQERHPINIDNIAYHNTMWEQKKKIPL